MDKDFKVENYENKEELEEDQKATAEYQFERLLNVLDMLGNLLKRVHVKTDLAVFLTNATGDFRMDDGSADGEFISLEDRLEALEYTNLLTISFKILIF